jgi:hypothetical protein
VELTEMIERVGSFIAVPAMIAFLLLLPLYLSQRRDIARLRSWMEHEPDHPITDLQASETLLDHAEADLERLLGERGEPVADTVVRSPDVPPPVAAARVTSERPALERITIERAALEPHPRWRRVTDSLTRTRALVAIGLVAVIAGTGAVVVSQRLLSVGPSGGVPAVSFDPSDVTVSVLNGTAVAGLAGKVQSDVAANGYEIDTLGAAPAPAERTLVMFRQGHRREAIRVARDLGVAEADVERIDPPTRRLAGDAEVVVVAGEDRAR